MHWWTFIVGLLVGLFIVPMVLKMFTGSKTAGG